MSNSEISVNQEDLEKLRHELALTKQQLAKKEQLIDTVFESTGAGYWQWRPKENEIYFSTTYKQLLGYTDEEHENSMEFYYSTMLEGERHKVAAALERISYPNKGKIYNHDAKYHHKNGSVVEMYCKGYATSWDEDGNPTEIIGTSYDVTKLKNIHGLLKDSETRLSLITRGSNAGIWDWDLTTNKVWWSPKYYEMLGYEPYSFDPSYDIFTKVLHPEDVELLERSLKNHFEKNRPFKIENRQLHKNGYYIWLESTGYALRDLDGKAVRMAGSVVDISDRKDLEHELLSNQELLTQTSEIAMVGGWEIDIRNNISTWSDVVYDIYEVEHDQPVTIDDFFRNFTSDSKEVIKAAVENASNNGEEFDLELPFITSDERHIWVRVIGRPIIEEKKIVKLSGVIQDITEKKLSEIQMEALTETLVYQNKQLEDYAHITSHNLRAPIANLNALISLYFKETEQSKKDVLIEKFTEASVKLMKTVDELTEVLMIKTSELRKIEDLDLQEILTGLLESLEAEIINKKAIITSDFSVAPVLKYFKPYLESILLNLLTNALKYSSPARQPKIHLKTHSHFDETILTITDNGLGINLDRHGEKLFKLHKTFHRQADSRGLGLYIVKNQVEVMGGSIDCESEENVGTTFTITFSKNLPEHIR